MNPPRLVTTAPTQTRHPWRATLRTAVAGAVALATLLPAILAGVDPTGSVLGAFGAQLLIVAGTVTRILAAPGVDQWLRLYVPWLAAAPQTDVVEPEDVGGVGRHAAR